MQVNIYVNADIATWGNRLHMLKIGCVSNTDFGFVIIQESHVKIAQCCVLGVIKALKVKSAHGLKR